jgi:ankyrin repeat protein
MNYNIPDRIDPNHYDFWDAVCRGRAEYLAEYLDKHPQAVNWKRGVDHDQTPLIKAAYGHADQRLRETAIVEMLLARGAKINDADAYGHSALFNACKAGKINIVKVLVENGADVDQRMAHGNGGFTPLIEAIICKRNDVVEYLLEKGAEIEKTCAGTGTPLWWAANSGNLSAAQMLLSRDADAFQRDYYGRTPLDEARRQNHSDIADLLEPIYARRWAEEQIQQIENGVEMPMRAVTMKTLVLRPGR